MSFRVAELQMLLGFAGKQKSGKKNELQVHALELLKGRNLTTSVQNKIKELHRQRYNNLIFPSSSVGNSSDSCDSDMASNYSHTSGHVTTRSAVAGMHHGMHSMTTQQNNMMSVSGQSSLTKQNVSRNDYYGSMPRGLGMDYAPKPSYQSLQPSVNMQYPVFPDVVFKSLPFFDNMAELLKPSSLGNDCIARRCN